MSPAKRLVHKTGQLAALLGAAGALALGALFGPGHAVSSAVGTLLGVANLWVLARLVVSLLDERKSRPTRTRAAVLLGAKGIALMVVVGALIVGRWVHGGAFMAGL